MVKSHPFLRKRIDVRSAHPVVGFRIRGNCAIGLIVGVDEEDVGFLRRRRKKGKREKKNTDSSKHGDVLNQSALHFKTQKRATSRLPLFVVVVVEESFELLAENTGVGVAASVGENIAVSHDSDMIAIRRSAGIIGSAALLAAADFDRADSVNRTAVATMLRTVRTPGRSSVLVTGTGFCIGSEADEGDSGEGESKDSFHWGSGVTVVTGKKTLLLIDLCRFSDFSFQSPFS